jgi:hypothetical protein
VIGHDPLRQFLVDGVGGRLQRWRPALIRTSGEWFNVYGDEDRKPGEWGHWTGRGMVWNQMCASVPQHPAAQKLRRGEGQLPHLDGGDDGVVRGLPRADEGARRVAADNMRRHPRKATPPTLPQMVSRSAHRKLRRMPCETRRDHGRFRKPGESFWDHYLLTVVDHSDTYYPDGQIRDENYEFASFVSSRMYHAGVRCMDCHDMHSMKTILPGNQLCMRCHTPGGFPNAPPIMPEAHSFHGIESTGNQCMNCHMPQTVYMQRHSASRSWLHHS